ncbi:metalloprotease 1-related protein, putative [Babesia caballi]|uniref:Metalloprotease 1-related protein, putative n=1 Tax=Babesia caballi TaxID=5871 RepID=A0AAV4LVQ7_BABCB|nr:metalloprotease 1-related protein, putative [Babesia caballi]
MTAVDSGAPCVSGVRLGTMIRGFVLANLVSVKHVIVHEYISQRSGLRVFLMEYESPIVSSFYVVPTRPENHEGLPHTLEHLVFLGSAKYPERGTLDQLASRALAMGTNAWTDVDQTVYTISTAGIEGTLKILPVYLDHLLRPTLTYEAFITDVHRITPDGSNAGSVYSEMKTRENGAESVTEFNMMPLLYPGGSGYSMVSGGRLEALRATNVDRVREYHKRFYRLDNLSIVIGGTLGDVEAVLEVAAQAEAELIAAGVEANPVDPEKYFGVKHWDDPVHCQPLLETARLTASFPSDDEKLGLFTMSWRGPRWEDHETSRALTILGSYLVDTQVSPMEKNLVYTDKPYGSTVSFELLEYKEGRLTLSVHDVPNVPETLDSVEKRICQVLLEVHTDPLDMERLHALIRRERMSYLHSIETSPANVLVDGVVAYILYGKEKGDLDEMLEGSDQLSRLLLKDEAFWKETLWKYFIAPPWVAVTTVPSIDRSRVITQQEEELVRRQLASSDLEELRRREEVVRSILLLKGSSVPKEVIDSFGYVDVANIRLTAWPYIRNFGAADLGKDGGRAVAGQVQLFNESGGRIPVAGWATIAEQLDALKFGMQLNHIASDFVRVTVMVPLARLELSHREKQSLTLLADVLFQSDLAEGLGPEMPVDHVIRQLQERTISYYAHLGLDSSLANPDAYSELFQLSVTCHVSNYETVVGLLHRVMLDVRFSPRIVGARMRALMKSLVKKGRSPKAVLRQAAQVLRLRRDGVRMSNGLGQQSKFLKDALRYHVMPDLQALYKKLFARRDLIVHVTCDATKLPEGWMRPWLALSGDGAASGLVRDSLGFRLGGEDALGETKGLLTPMSSADVGFLTFSILAPLGFSHGEYAALLLLTEYLCLMEGPLWRAIRGGGFSYDYSVSYLPSVGELRLSIFQASNLVGALTVAREAFQQMAHGEMLVEQDVMSARCSLVYSILEGEETLSDYSDETFHNVFRGVGSRFTAELLAQLRQVTVEDLRQLAVKYLTQFQGFGPEWRTLVAVTNTDDGPRLHEQLDAMGYVGVAYANAKRVMAFATNGIESYSLPRQL